MQFLYSCVILWRTFLFSRSAEQSLSPTIKLCRFYLSVAHSNSNTPVSFFRIAKTWKQQTKLYPHQTCTPAKVTQTSQDQGRICAPFLQNAVDNRSHFDMDPGGFDFVKDVSKVAEPRTALGYTDLHVTSSLAVCRSVVDDHKFQTEFNFKPLPKPKRQWDIRFLLRLTNLIRKWIQLM